MESVFLVDQAVSAEKQRMVAEEQPTKTSEGSSTSSTQCTIVLVIVSLVSFIVYMICSEVVPHLVRVGTKVDALAGHDRVSTLWVAVENIPAT